MLAYSYLVLGVNPTSNEANVDLSSKITITFAKHINTDTINSNTLRLKKVNGEFVDYVGQYDSLNKTYTITPSMPLSPNTQYQTIVIGGKDGVISIDGSYLPATKTYEFVTVEREGVAALENLVLTQDYYFVSARWSMPNGLAVGEEIHFNVRLSSSKNPDAFDLWPKNPIEGKTTSSQFTIPYKLEPGQNYYVYVQGVTKNKETEWIGKQIYIENVEVTQPTQPPIVEDSEETSNDDSPETTPLSQLTVLDTFPQNGQLEKPSEILVVFSHELDGEQLDSDLVKTPLLYVVQAQRKSQYTVLDLRSKYSPKNALEGVLSVDEENGNILVWTPTEGGEAFVENREYTVILSKNLTGIDALPLGYTHSFSFIGTPEHLHGDIEHIKETLQSLNIEPSTSFLQSLMRKYSQFACDIWYESSTYDESLHQDGEAPYYIHQYVNTQVLIDALLNGGASSAAAGGGTESISLGELTVNKSGGSTSTGSSTSITSVISKLQSRLKAWEDLIHGHHNRGYASPGSTVKGESVETYPEFITRTEMTTDFDE